MSSINNVQFETTIYSILENIDESPAGHQRLSSLTKQVHSHASSNNTPLRLHDECISLLFEKFTSCQYNFSTRRWIGVFLQAVIHHTISSISHVANEQLLAVGNVLLSRARGDVRLLSFAIIHYAVIKEVNLQRFLPSKSVFKARQIDYQRFSQELGSSNWENLSKHYVNHFISNNDLVWASCVTIENRPKLSFQGCLAILIADRTLTVVRLSAGSPILFLDIDIADLHSVKIKMKPHGEEGAIHKASALDMAFRGDSFKVSVDTTPHKAQNVILWFRDLETTKVLWIRIHDISASIRNTNGEDNTIAEIWASRRTPILRVAKSSNPVRLRLCSSSSPSQPGNPEPDSAGIKTPQYISLGQPSVPSRKIIHQMQDENFVSNLPRKSNPSENAYIPRNIRRTASPLPSLSRVKMSDSDLISGTKDNHKRKTDSLYTIHDRTAAHKIRTVDSLASESEPRFHTGHELSRAASKAQHMPQASLGHSHSPELPELPGDASLNNRDLGLCVFERLRKNPHTAMMNNEVCDPSAETILCRNSTQPHKSEKAIQEVENETDQETATKKPGERSKKPVSNRHRLHEGDSISLPWPKREGRKKPRIDWAKKQAPRHQSHGPLQRDYPESILDHINEFELAFCSDPVSVLEANHEKEHSPALKTSSSADVISDSRYSTLDLVQDKQPSIGTHQTTRVGIDPEASQSYLSYHNESSLLDANAAAADSESSNGQGLAYNHEEVEMNRLISSSSELVERITQTRDQNAAVDDGDIAVARESTQRKIARVEDSNWSDALQPRSIPSWSRLGMPLEGRDSRPLLQEDPTKQKFQVNVQDRFSQEYDRGSRFKNAWLPEGNLKRNFYDSQDKARRAYIERSLCFANPAVGTQSPKARGKVLGYLESGLSDQLHAVMHSLTSTIASHEALIEDDIRRYSKTSERLINNMSYAHAEEVAFHEEVLSKQSKSLSDYLNSLSKDVDRVVDSAKKCASRLGSLLPQPGQVSESPGTDFTKLEELCDSNDFSQSPALAKSLSNMDAEGENNGDA